MLPGVYYLTVIHNASALTSSISILEVVVAYLVEENNLTRVKATIIASASITVIGVLCTLSIGPLSDFLIFGLNVFDLLDFAASNVLLPLGGMLISIFVGWKLDRNIVIGELSNYGTIRIVSINLFIFLVRYVAPLAILVVFLHGIGVFSF